MSTQWYLYWIQKTKIISSACFSWWRHASNSLWKPRTAIPYRPDPCVTEKNFIKVLHSICQILTDPKNTFRIWWVLQSCLVGWTPGDYTRGNRNKCYMIWNVIHRIISTRTWHDRSRPVDRPNTLRTTREAKSSYSQNSTLKGKPALRDESLTSHIESWCIKNPGSAP